jgi:transcription antitermination factor NusG
LLKTSENPPIIWPPEKSINDFTGLWWVAHTKSRNEKALARDLVCKDIHYFLPMTWSVQRRRGRTIRSLLPLFNGYLFFCGEEKHRVELLKTNRVASLIRVENQETLLTELSQIELAIRSGAPLKPHKYITVGEHCRVIGGALVGLEGIVVRTQTSTHLVLQIDILGKATSVEVDMDMIEVLDKDS